MKRGRRKGGNKDKVFGCDLLEHLAATNQEIPQVLRSCSEFIEEHGIVDGIYRLSGVSSNTQKLRSEFDNEGNPDLYKDVYLQDIHCVSSLCKAYFRELPNPLLTYQLYDHFAEAVAVQLEDERLVKIKEVLKELPVLHYKTLEYLMRHLVKMSKYSDQTNMHARNIAIVWAPNLLRSKDIEASGFNGTAAFMEVRVQSIVVEFILTHVAQLFPDLCTETGLALERRKSLPSPTALGQDEQFFKAIPFQYPGNMSPGDGPPPMRPYHAIIDGTDKRKGSLKGRKWRSIFNLGGRLQDPRKKNKCTAKEKEKTALRPAKSMDSLSSGPYTLEDSRNPSSHLSSLVPSSGTSESGNPGTGGMGSGYAVTYRRTGGASVSMVSGGSGIQGTYKSLDTGSMADRSQVAPQGAVNKAERRAGMHISGPFSVTVPLHITSGLAMGVLHGVRNEEEQGMGEEEQPNKVKKEDAGENKQPAEGEIEQTFQKTEGSQQDKNDPNEEEENSKTKTEVEEREQKDREEPPESDFLRVEEESSQKHHATDRPSLNEVESDYMDMKPGVPQDSAAAVGHCEMASGPLCVEEEYQDPELLLDFQDTFGFLDSMDTSAPNQLNEFSVEPPGFEEEEEEEDEENDQPNQPPPSLLLSHTDIEEPSLPSTNFPVPKHRLLPGKSHSLPYKSLPFLPAQSSSSDDFTEPDDDDDDDDDEDASDSDKDEYEDMFFKSLPNARHFQGLNWTGSQAVTLNSPDCSVDLQANNQSQCLHQTHNTELNESGLDLPAISNLTGTEQTDAEIIPDDGMDTQTVVQSLNKNDLSPLSLETLEHLSMGEDQRKTEDKSTKNLKEECGSEKVEHLSEPVQETNKEMESTDNGEDAHSCCQEETQYSSNEDEEDTYFGPDSASTMPQPINNETSYTNNQLLIKEEDACKDDQRYGSEGFLDITASEEPDEPDGPPGTTSLASHNENYKLPLEQTFTLFEDKQGQTNSTEVGDEHSGTMEVGKEGECIKGNISVLEKNSPKEDFTECGHIESESGKEVDAVELEYEINKDTKQDHESVTTKKEDKTESKEVEEEAEHEVDEHLVQKEVQMVGGEEQSVLESNEEGVEKLIKKGKKEKDEVEENNGQMVEETKVKKESNLEGVTEIKEGSIPEKRIAREMSEEEDKLSEDSSDSRDSGALLVEPQGDIEEERAMEETNAEASMSGVEKPLRHPRMKEIQERRGIDLGQGVGRTVVKSKQVPARVYQVKAVPVVPPKPQHSKITAFKQQFQQRDHEKQLDRGLQHRDVVRHPQLGDIKCSLKDKDPGEAENGGLRQNPDHQNTERGQASDGQKVEENKADQIKPKLKDTPSGDSSLGLDTIMGEDREDQGIRRGTWDGGSWRKDGQKELDRETKRASGISICFDEAVARATGKRCREKDDRFIDLQWEKGDQKEGSMQKKREEEGKTD